MMDKQDKLVERGGHFVTALRHVTGPMTCQAPSAVARLCGDAATTMAELCAALASPSTRTGLEALTGRASYPAKPSALAASIAYLDRHADDCLDEIENWQEYGESVTLVLHELKRLRALSNTMGDVTADGWRAYDLSDPADLFVECRDRDGDVFTMWIGDFLEHQNSEEGTFCDDIVAYRLPALTQADKAGAE